MKKPNQIKDSENFTTLGIVGLGLMVVIYMVNELIQIVW